MAQPYKQFKQCHHSIKFMSDLDYFSYTPIPLVFNLRCRECLNNLNANIRHVTPPGVWDDACAVSKLLGKPTRLIYN
jgi:hypothetical protein